VQDEQGSIVVVASGSPYPASRDRLPAGAVVVAADGGVDAALALGLEVSLAIGDFDSVSSAGLTAVEAAGARIERHPAAKDASDLELALDRATELGAGRIVVVGADGGRLDHLLEGLLLLGSDRYADVEIDALLGPATAHVVRGDRTLEGSPGELVSLLPLHGPAEGVVTTGLVYPLRGERLEPGSSRGLSNVFAEPTASITLTGGVLVALRPGPEERSAG
jgi:thiamine pyrophosphokinase